MPNRERGIFLMHVGGSARPSGRLWNPSADVYKTADGWIVKVDLAGVCSDELEIDVSGNNLHIRGCRRDTLYREDYSYHQMEITYSHFEKTIQLPDQIESATIAHDYRDGFLIVSLRCS
jgi:HSP20 family protein